MTRPQPTTHIPLIDLIAQVKASPDNREALFTLMEQYLDEATDDDTRQQVRETITADRRLVLDLEQWYLNETTTEDALLHLRRGLAWLSMTDAQPSRQDALTAFEELIAFARRYEIDPVPHLRYIRQISGERVRDILTEGKRPRMTFRQFGIANALLLLALLPVMVVTEALPTQARGFMLFFVFALLVGGQLFLLYRYMGKAWGKGNPR